MHRIRHKLAALGAGTTLLLAACGGGGDGAPPATAAPDVGVTQASAMPMSADGQETGRGLDVAILGEGLLVGHDPATGERVYTRWGRLELDSEGRLVHAQGWHMGGVSVADATGHAGEDLAGLERALPPVPWKMPFKADTQVTLELQFDSRREAIARELPFDAHDPTTYHFATMFDVTDAQGDTVYVVLYLRRLPSDDLLDHVAVYATAQGAAVASDAQGVWQTLSFRRDGSQVAETAERHPLRVAPGGPGRHLPRLESLGVALQATFMGDQAAVWNIGRDGYPGGHLQTVKIDLGGRITLFYGNGQERDHATLVVARPTLTDRYRRVGAAGWQCAALCTTPTIAVPGERLTGFVQQGWLASSF